MFPWFGRKTQMKPIQLNQRKQFILFIMRSSMVAASSTEYYCYWAYISHKSPFPDRIDAQFQIQLFHLFKSNFCIDLVRWKKKNEISFRSGFVYFTCNDHISFVSIARFDFIFVPSFRIRFITIFVSLPFVVIINNFIVYHAAEAKAYETSARKSFHKKTEEETRNERIL